MNNASWAAVFLLILTIFCIIPVAAETATESGYGWYVIHCNVEFAKVYLDDKYVGETTLGTLTVQVPTSPSYKIIRIQKSGYSTFTDSIKKTPSPGESVNIYAAISPLPETTETVVGGDMGWYVVHCNIEGATVFFDDSNKGEISRGIVYVPVFSTATPYREYSVKKDGYATFSAPIPTVPGKGESYDLYATLNPVTTAPATAAKVGGDIGYYKINSNVEGASVSFDNEEKGKISQGNLTVRVYVTGTPYKTFTVYKAGYVPFTGVIDTYPAKGETVNLDAKLTAQPTDMTSPATTAAQQSPISPWTCAFAVIISGAIVMLARK
jgi:hypothetical protein